MKRRKGGNVIARKASKKIKTIAGRLTREMERKLTPQSLQKWGSDLQLFQKVLAQKKEDSNKIYSLHEPQVNCFSKGKEHKKYEFGSKASFLITQKTGVIVGALNFSENIHDSKTLPAALEQHQRLTGIKAKEVFVDRGYPGPKQIGDTQILLPKPNKNIALSQRKKHSRRAAIEPVIGHLKHDYRMIKNFLKGSFGDTVNVMLAASAMNFKRMMNLWKKGKVSLAQFFSLLLQQLFLPIYFKHQSRNLKLTF
jgi:IS5 family transposase